MPRIPDLPIVPPPPYIATMTVPIGKSSPRIALKASSEIHSSVSLTTEQLRSNVLTQGILPVKYGGFPLDGVPPLTSLLISQSVTFFHPFGSFSPTCHLSTPFTTTQPTRSLQPSKPTAHPTAPTDQTSAFKASSLSKRFNPTWRSPRAAITWNRL